MSIWSRAAQHFLMDHDFLMTTVKVITEPAVTDGEWGSEAGQQWCASRILTDITYRLLEPHMEKARNERLHPEVLKIFKGAAYQKLLTASVAMT